MPILKASSTSLASRTLAGPPSTEHDKTRQEPHRRQNPSNLRMLITVLIMRAIISSIPKSLDGSQMLTSGLTRTILDNLASLELDSRLPILNNLFDSLFVLSRGGFKAVSEAIKLSLETLLFFCGSILPRLIWWSVQTLRRIAIYIIQVCRFMCVDAVLDSLWFSSWHPVALTFCAPTARDASPVASTTYRITYSYAIPNSRLCIYSRFS